MKHKHRSGPPLDVNVYLQKYKGLEVIEGDSDGLNENETIVLDKWVRHDFPEMGVVQYNPLKSKKGENK